MCVPDVVKSLKVKVFNLISRTNETRHIEWHEICVDVDQMEPFIKINNVRMMTNTGEDAKN